jgi:hypothetical protein
MDKVSDFADERFKNNSTNMTSIALNYAEFNKIPFENILTNKEKILGLYNNYKPLGKIPSRYVFNGNRNNIDTIQFLEKSIIADENFTNGKSFLLIYNSRSQKANLESYEYLSRFNSENLLINEFKDGYIVKYKELKDKNGYN